MRARVAVVAACVLALAGCTGQGDPGPSVTPPSGAHDLVFRVAITHSPVPPEAAFVLPELSVYGDGLLVSAAADQATPATGLPAPVQRRLTPAGVQRLLDGARTAGLTGPTDLGTPAVPDAPVTTFTLPDRVTDVVLVNDDGADLAGAQRAARERLRTFVGQLADLDGWLGDDVSPAEPYPYSQLAVLALTQAPQPAAPTRPWPLQDLSQAGTSHGDGRCVLLTGTELDTVTDAATGTSPATGWRSGDATYHLTFRPLLPDEQDCATLTR